MDFQSILSYWRDFLSTDSAYTLGLILGGIGGTSALGWLWRGTCWAAKSAATALETYRYNKRCPAQRVTETAWEWVTDTVRVQKLDAVEDRRRLDQEVFDFKKQIELVWEKLRIHGLSFEAHRNQLNANRETCTEHTIALEELKPKFQAWEQTTGTTVKNCYAVVEALQEKIRKLQSRVEYLEILAGKKSEGSAPAMTLPEAKAKHSEFTFSNDEVKTSVSHLVSTTREVKDFSFALVNALGSLSVGHYFVWKHAAMQGTTVYKISKIIGDERGGIFHVCAHRQKVVCLGGISYWFNE